MEKGPLSCIVQWKHFSYRYYVQNFNVVETYEISTCYKIIILWYFTMAMLKYLWLIRKLYSLRFPLFFLDRYHFAHRKRNISYKKRWKTYDVGSIRECAKGLLSILNRLGLIRNLDWNKDIFYTLHLFWVSMNDFIHKVTARYFAVNISSKHFDGLLFAHHAIVFPNFHDEFQNKNFK